MKIKAALFLITALSGHASAAVLANYVFLDSNLSASSPAAGITAGQVALSGGALTSNDTDMVLFRASLTADTLAASITDGDYLQVTIQAAAGQTLSLESLVFDHLISNQSASFTTNFAVFASLDGFATAPVSGGQLATATGGATVSSGTSVSTLNNDFTVSLANPQFQNLTSSTTVTFRIYGFDSTNGASDYGRIDDLRINGSVIPEPSSLLLGALGAFALSSRRRR